MYLLGLFKAYYKHETDRINRHGVCDDCDLMETMDIDRGIRQLEQYGDGLFDTKFGPGHYIISFVSDDDDMMACEVWIPFYFVDQYKQYLRKKKLKRIIQNPH